MVRRFLGVSCGGDCWSVIEQSEDGQRLFPLCHQSQVRTSRGATLEISQLRSGWCNSTKRFTSRGTMEMPDDPAVPSGRIFVCNQPDTECLANFRLSLRDDANGADASRFNGFNARKKRLTCCAVAQRRRKRLGFSLYAGHSRKSGGFTRAGSRWAYSKGKLRTSVVHPQRGQVIGTRVISSSENFLSAGIPVIWSLISLPQ